MKNLMPEYLYRFRTVDSLLGLTRESELEGAYIYFASPAQLNDPLEGYRELIWKGDSIIWTNFFKHYIECLFIRNTQYFTQQFEDLQVPIHPHLNDVPPKHAKAIIDNIYKFIENKNIQRHITYLSSNQRTVYSSELLLHTRSIQLFAMHVVSKVLVEYGLVPDGYGINGESPENLLITSNKLLDSLEQRVDSARGKIFDQTMLAALQSIDLTDGYIRFKQQESSNWVRLCNEFPEEFLNSRIRLTSPDWFVSCFMDNCSNSSIWGSYGDNHKGACLKFKVTTISESSILPLQVPSLREGVQWWTEKNFVFHKVDYKRKSPELDFFSSFGAYTEGELISKWYSNESGDISSRTNEVFGDLSTWQTQYHLNHQISLTTKTRHWANEQEYRLILQSNFHSYINANDRKLKYNFNDLEGIIFGINTPLSEKYQIMQIVERMCKSRNREDFTFYQAYYSDVDDDIQYRPIAHATVNNGITRHSYNYKKPNSGA